MSMKLPFFGTLLAQAAFSAAQIPPEHAANLTVYHVNPRSAGAVPVNMDTGDVSGDLYFYLGEFLLPLECTPNQSSQFRARFDCDNPERRNPHLVVTKVDLQVDKRWTSYSACNLCNGTDPLSGKPCRKGEYVCNCFGFGCNKARIGKQNISQVFAYRPPSNQCTNALNSKCGLWRHFGKKICGMCIFRHMKYFTGETCEVQNLPEFCGFTNPMHICSSAAAPEWACWSENIPRWTGGFWYSTLKQGMCDEFTPSGTCSWNVLSTKTVTEACVKNSIMSRVESESPVCFQNCGRPRNTTDTCWISCFFDTLFGPEARHSTLQPFHGLPLEEVQDAWESAFSSQDEGCEEVAIPRFAIAATPSSGSIVI